MEWFIIGLVVVGVLGAMAKNKEAEVYSYMNTLKLIAAAIVLNLAYITSSIAQEPIIQPSFGLKWSASIAEIEAQYTVVERDKSTPGLTLLVLTGEQFPSNTGNVFALVASEFGLVKVVWNSKNFTDDPFGNEGKEQFDILYLALSKKLGAGQKITTIGGSLYDENDEFYECLEYAGCGNWLAFWKGTESDNSAAMLQLKGQRRGEGYLSYGVESPDWYIWNDKQKTGDVSKF